MPITREKKKEIVKELAEKFKKAKTIVFSEFKGINIKDSKTLRKKLREKNIDYKVAKKTLIKLAAKEAGYENLPKEFLLGSISLSFSYEDEITPAKILKEFSSSHITFKMVGAFIDKEIIQEDKLKYLASLPSKEELLSKLIGSMKSPVTGFYCVLNGLLSGFVRVVKGYAEKKI